tara:strand:+ start:67972 stop:68784 length:813 start_codon:yes stop_codon:yes gene_type:complete
VLQNSQLGKTSTYNKQYDASLLFPISRQENRDAMGVTSKLPFHGVDIWNAYEISWLNSKGKPQIVVGKFHVPAESENITESKSLKLYLNSFNQTKFTSADAVKNLIQADLSRATQSTVTVKLIPPSDFQQQRFNELPGRCIDDIDVSIDIYEHDASLLQTAKHTVEETLHSHLLKSNCLITRQPDWASVMIRYSGNAIDHASLLKYLISFRNHNEFHEPCAERIFTDIMRECTPEKLSVYARFTRRGGIDINPFRSNFENNPTNFRNFRQ